MNCCLSVSGGSPQSPCNCGPCVEFSAFLAAGQVLVQGTDDPIVGWTEVYDDGGAFDAATGLWTTPVLGYSYYVTLHFGSRILSTNTGAFGSAWLYKNGAQFKLGSRYLAPFAPLDAYFVGFAVRDKTAGGDVYQARIFMSGAAAGSSATGNAGGSFTWFQGGISAQCPAVEEAPDN